MTHRPLLGRLLGTLLVLLLSSVTLAQQASPVAADTPPAFAPGRPGFAEPSLPVGRNVFQVEGGFLVTAFVLPDSSTRTTTFPLPSLRYGLTDDIEVRLTTGGFSQMTLTSAKERPSTRGATDPELALKWHLKAHPAGFDLAIVPAVLLPMGAAAFSTGGYDPSLKLAWSRSVPRGWTLAGNLIAASLTAGTERWTQSTASVALSRTITGPWSAYAEVYTQSPASKDGTAAWVINGGAARTIGANSQVDVQIGRGLNDASLDWFVSAGFVVRRLPAKSR